jgi:hypothetical protein
MYRGLRKSIWCRDSVQQREAGGGGTGRLDKRPDSTRDLGLPDRSGNLADRSAEHNRSEATIYVAIRGDVLPRAPLVDLWIRSRYSSRGLHVCHPSDEDAGDMTTFDKREEGFEKKFAHDEELRFKATARRNKMLGLWAAAKLGLAGDAANSYAKEVVMSDFEEAGDHDVLKKVHLDLEKKGVAHSEAEIRRVMNDLMEKAIAEINAS